MVSLDSCFILIMVILSDFRIPYTYDGLGNVTSVTNAVNGVKKTACDANGQIIEEANELAGNGNLLKKTNERGKSCRYEYDKNNRPVKTTDPLGGETKISYTPNGLKAGEEDANGGVVSYTYDKNKNRKSILHNHT